MLLRPELPLRAQLQVPPLLRLRRGPGATRGRLIMSEAVDASVLVASLDAERGRFVDFLRRRVGADAEDLYQQCLLRAWEHAGSLRDRASARPWFYRMLRNAAADHLGASRAQDARHEALRRIEPEAVTPASESACTCAPKLLAKLPARYAELLRRVDLEDERVVDVARALGISADNANVRLHRARAAIRASLDGCCGARSMRACMSCDCPP